MLKSFSDNLSKVKKKEMPPFYKIRLATTITIHSLHIFATVFYFSLTIRARLLKINIRTVSPVVIPTSWL